MDPKALEQALARLTKYADDQSLEHQDIRILLRHLNELKKKHQEDVLTVEAALAQLEEVKRQLWDEVAQLKAQTERQAEWDSNLAGFEQGKRVRRPWWRIFG